MKLVLIVFMLISVNALARGWDSGGGDPREGDFAKAGLDLANQMPYLSADFSKLAADFRKATDETQVKCASGELLDFLVNQNQMAYYYSDKDLISLHCDRWSKESGSTGAFINVAHEYFRVLGVESKEYNYSKRLVSAIQSRGHAVADSGRFEGFKGFVDKFNKSNAIDDVLSLGRASTYTCTVVDRKERMWSRDYVFERQAAQGTYRSETNDPQFPQFFILNQSGELQTTSSPKIIFRQYEVGKLVGITRDKSINLRKLRFDEDISEAVFCRRISMSPL